MAAPYISGVAALYISVHGGRKTSGKEFGKFLSKQIIASGKALPWSDGTATDYGFAASVAQVGNGLVDAYKVVKYTTDLAFEKIALNDTAFFSRYHDIAVTNGGKESVTYSFSNSAAAGVEAAGVCTTNNLRRAFTDYKISGFHKLEQAEKSASRFSPSSLQRSWRRMWFCHVLSLSSLERARRSQSTSETQIP